jgi:hypothetical protein
MRLNLSALQKVVKQALDDERATEALRTEVSRVLGPAVLVECNIVSLVEEANDRIDVLERTGRASRLDFKPSVMLRFLDHKDPNVRRLAARVVPEKFLSKVVNDKNHSVRAAVARRLPLRAVSEMLKKFPNDDQVRVIYKNKKLAEAGIPTPTIQDDPFDMYGEDRLGDAVKQDEGSALSDTWYKSRAEQFVADYGRNIENAWESAAVHRYVASVKATSGVEVDEQKLLKAVVDLLEDRDERTLKRSSIKETIDWLRKNEELEESVMPSIEFDVDQVRGLVEGNLTPATFIDSANELFDIRESSIPSAIRKYCLSEHTVKNGKVPVIGQLPHNGEFRSIDERALDMYCEAWNAHQSLVGEPLRIEWSTHPERIGKISFNVSLR